ncbi:MAG: glycosyltransferase family 2 protein [Hadesarchaea archaeon]|nr:glycosyltransferase family 2 protein [Hadesarchaea archaeon]
MDENSRGVEVSLIFPAHNEAEKIEWAVRRAIEALKNITRSYEIIIAEDGSTDGTDKIASRLSEKYSSVRHFHSDKRLGKGGAIKRASKKCKGRIIAFMDVDLATDIKHLKELIQTIRDGYDFAMGSRMLPESKAERTISRAIASSVYNLMVRLFFRTGIRDHQCGFKSFRRSALLSVLDDVKADHWFWDTELLVRASKRGYTIKEFPVEWRHTGETKVNLLRDSIDMITQVLKLWWKINSPRLLGKIKKQSSSRR